MSEFKSGTAYMTFHNIAPLDRRLYAVAYGEPRAFKIKNLGAPEGTEPGAFDPKMVAEVERMQAQLTHHVNAMMYLANAEREAVCLRMIEVLGLRRFEEHCSHATDIDRPLWIALRFDDVIVWEAEFVEGKYESRWLADPERFQ